MSRVGRLALMLATLATLGPMPGRALGERAQDGNLIVSLNGRIAPRQLPRHRPAPVALHVEGTVGTSDGSPLPQLTQVRLELAGPGLLSTRGLPVCPGGRLSNADSRQAIYRCGDALVGDGSLAAEIFVQGQRPFTIYANLLAFNGRTHAGQTTVWVHAYSHDPPISLALPFKVRARQGAFGTALVATLPPFVGPLPHLASFDLTLSRRFAYRGKLRSYIRAACPVPKPFTAGFLAFARASYGFEEGSREVSVESVRSCRAD